MRLAISAMTTKAHCIAAQKNEYGIPAYAPSKSLQFRKTSGMQNRQFQDDSGQTRLVHRSGFHGPQRWYAARENRGHSQGCDASSSQRDWCCGSAMPSNVEHVGCNASDCSTTLTCSRRRRDPTCWTRIGLQVARIGEGRPDSKKSAGMGWGQFKRDGQFTLVKDRI